MTEMCPPMSWPSVVGRSGVPVPAVRRTSRGEAVTDLPRVGSVVLSTFVQGAHHRRGSIPDTAATAMGRTLGTLHHLLARFAAPRPYAVPPPAAAQTRLEGVLQAAERRRGRSVVDAICCRVLRHKLDALHRHGRLADRFPPLLAQATHGDYQETNVLFDEADRVVGVLDFDNVRIQPRVVEVSRALTLDFLPDGRLLPEADAFLAGYHETGRLTEAEAEVLAPLFRDLWLRPDLAPRDRSLVTVSALITAGQVAQIPFHLNKAMDNGLTRAQAGEVLTQLAFYAGWPHVFSAVPVVKEVLASRPPW